MMSSAFLGNDFIKKAYEQAMKEKYNFLSYGDSMLII
jgi:S-adenosylmethionine:tRNA ribosyltransferase-isomerase